MRTDRRHLLQSLAVGGALLGATAALPAAGASAAARAFVPPAGPRCRVLYCNDLAGDIDGLFATVHMILSPSVDLRGIVGTLADTGNSARDGKALADEMLRLMNRTGTVATFEGAAARLAAMGAPVRSAGTQAIIAEAMRTDSTLPLYVAVGGGLTEVASALMIEPAIAGRFTLVWIGGGAPQPAGQRYEANFGIDPLAAQHVFNATSVPIWQVPSEVYRTCIVSDAELNVFVRPCGAIGQWLYDSVVRRSDDAKRTYNAGATWTLGDSPLVVLTALTDWVWSTRTAENGPYQFEATGSSRYEVIRAPRLDTMGVAAARPDGRRMRLYRDVDQRLMFGDFFAKLREHTL